MSRKSYRSGKKDRFAGLKTPRTIVSIAVLISVGASVGWLSIEAAMIRSLPATPAGSLRFVPNNPEAILRRATTMLVANRGILDTNTLDAVRRAAAVAPLDARAYLIIGHQQLLDHTPERAVATLEAGQRLDPRQRLIHLLLLDRYLRTARYADAAAQFSVLARLLGVTQPAIATAMAKMSIAPETRAAIRRTLRTDPALERGVLLALAKSDTTPSVIFALASPTAHADARNPASWGPALVDRLVTRGQYSAARLVWQRIYGLSPAVAAMPIVNPTFHKISPLPPFDWTLIASGLGAADIRNDALSIDYYGRDSGELARQLLVLDPGRYRFAFTIDPGKMDNTSKLFWSLVCGTTNATDDREQLMNVAVTATARPRRIDTDVVIPSDCPAQTLRLRGEAADFPAPIALTLRDLDLRLLSEVKP